jgi:hypothetical protein
MSNVPCGMGKRDEEIIASTFKVWLIIASYVSKVKVLLAILLAIKFLTAA